MPARKVYFLSVSILERDTSFFGTLFPLTIWERVVCVIASAGRGVARGERRGREGVACCVRIRRDGGRAVYVVSSRSSHTGGRSGWRRFVGYDKNRSPLSPPPDGKTRGRIPTAKGILD